MVEYLSKLFSSFVVLEAKFHSIHTDVKWALYLSVHPFMWDLYNFFWDQKDWLKERVVQLWDKSPCNLNKCLELSVIKELDKVEKIEQSLKTVLADLQVIDWLLKEWIKSSQDDLVTQNKLIDFQETVWVYIMKVKATLSI